MVAFLPLCHPDAELGLGVVKFQDDIPKVLFFPGKVRILPEQAPEVEGIGQPLFLSQLGDAVQYASVMSKDEDEFKRTLKRQGVDVKETKGGWSYYMMDETGGKRRKRRRKASNLADDLTKDSIE